jgi:hypothetical protein
MESKPNATDGGRIAVMAAHPKAHAEVSEGAVLVVMARSARVIV